MTSSPSLLDRAGAANKRIRTLAGMNSLASKADAVRTRANALKSAADALDPIGGVVRAFREHGIPTQAIDTAALNSLREQLTQLGKAYRDNPDQIAAPDGRYRYALWEPLGALPTNLGETLLTSWQAYCAALTPHQQSGVLEVLSGVPGLQQDALRIAGLRDELDRRSRALPWNETDLVRVSDLAAKIDLEWKSIEGTGIPADVLNFLKKASVGGASLPELTAEVRTWLEERSLGGFIRITMNSR